MIILQRKELVKSNKYEDSYATYRESIPTDYYKEIIWLANKYNVKQSAVEIDPYHPCGDICISINGKWCGYIDTEFYKMMDRLPSSWDYPDDE